MERKLWQSVDGVDYKEKHCGNCALSILRLGKEKDKYCKAKVVQINETTVKVISTCSGQELEYLKETIWC